MLRSSKRLAGQSNGPSPKRSKVSQESLKKVPKQPEFPKWSNGLKKVHIVDKEWVVGYASSMEEAQEAIDAHSRSLMCDYLRSHPGLGAKCKKSKSDSRLLWHSKQIPFDGTPFSVASYYHYKCSYSFRCKNKKPGEENKTKPVDEDNNSKGKYTCCPAKLTMKEIIKYPSSSLPLTASKQQKLASLKRLKEDLKTKEKVSTESRFIVSLPLASLHNHQFWGKYRVLNKSIRKRIKQIHESGIESPKKIKQKLEKSVLQDFADNLCPPHKEDQAFYPSLRTIYCVVNGKKPSFVTKKPTVKPVSPPAPKALPEAEKSLRPATLEEAVAIFCTDDEFTQNESYEVDVVAKIREKLDSIRKVSEALVDSNHLIDLYNTLCLMCDQYAAKIPRFQSFNNGVNETVVIASGPTLFSETIFLSPESVSDDSSSHKFTLGNDAAETDSELPSVSSEEGLPCSSMEPTTQDQMELLRQQIMLGHDRT